MKKANAQFNVLRSLLTFSSFVLVSSVIVACSTSGEQRDTKAATAGEIPDEVSLRADRSSVEEARKNIPESVRRENDELSSVLSLMAGGDEEPSVIRDRFNKALRVKRDKNDKLLRERRENFMRTSRAERESFLAKAKEEREDFVRAKRSSEERKRFFDREDQNRKAFFADANDKMKDFEAKLTEDRKTFEDYARERQNQFNAQLRVYSEKFQDWKKNLELKRRAEQKAQAAQRANQPAGQDSGPGSGADPLQEWREIPKTRGTDLTPREN